MPETQVYNTESAATYDSDLIEISNDTFQLKLQEVSQDFTEDFANDTGFTYDSDLAEFSGGAVQQKDQTEGALSGANFDSTVDLESWSGGTVTGTATGGAAVSGGKLDLAHNDIRYVDYVASGNAQIVQTGCIRFELTPNYSGLPSSRQGLFLIRAAASNNNLLFFNHGTDGNLYLLIYNSSDSQITNMDFGAFSPTASTPYEIELNVDVTSGASRVFVDGTQNGSTNISTGTRSSSIAEMKIGSNVAGNEASNFKMDNLLIFDSVQHTANYTPSGNDVTSTKYLASTVILPEMEHSGDGTITAFNTFATTESGSPRVTLDIGQSGDDLYWSGSAWGISDGTYAQATDAVTFNTNCGSLPVSGENYGQFKIYFTDSNTQSSVSELTANMDIELYSTTNPTITFTETIRSDGVESFVESASISGSDNIKYTHNGKYITGGAWATSDGIYSQSSVVSDNNTYASDLTTIPTTIETVVFLHSENGLTTPTLTSLTTTYSFAGAAPSLNEVLVYGYLYDLSGTALSSKTVKCRAGYIIGDLTIISNDYISTTTDSLGYWEMAIKYETTQPSSLYWEFYTNETKRYTTNFLTGTKKFSELSIIEGS